MFKMALNENFSDSCQNMEYHRLCNESNILPIDALFFLINTMINVTRAAVNCIYNFAGVVFLALILVLIIYILYKSYWSPVIYIKELTEVGYEHITGPDRDKRIARAQAVRRLSGKIPPPYPNGWFAVAESLDLKIGDVKAVDCLGLNLCVYRGEDSIARCVAAYCPHLGANLAVGGAVSGSCIECPFHKWTFDKHGACVAVPGVDVAPKGVSIKTYNTVEADGAVWIWHDADNRPPLWNLTNASECSRWGYRGRNEFYVATHIQEIPENGADVAHLNAVHSPSLLVNEENHPILSDLIGRHVWDATWKSNEDHTASMTLTHDYNIMKCNLLHSELKITQLGPGHVRLLMQTTLGPLLLSQSVTPLGPLLQRVVHRVFTPVHSAPLALPLIYAESKMIERDVKIWNSKRFVSAPAYVKTDKTIRAFRNWFLQFYSENSISFKDALQNPLDW